MNTDTVNVPFSRPDACPVHGKRTPHVRSGCVACLNVLAADSPVPFVPSFDPADLPWVDAP